MQVITGDETGLLKLIDLSSRTYFKYGEQCRANSISDIMYLGEKTVLSIKANSMLDIYSIDSTSDITLRLEKSSLIAIDNPISSHNLITNSLCSDNTIILYNSIGAVSVYNINQDYNINEIVNFNVTGPLEASDTCNDGGILLGGKENDAKLFNIETKQEVWVAKNVSQDKLHLRVPIWITSLSFQNPLQDSINSAIFFAGTAHKHVRVYDTKASQQPVISLDIGGDFRVSAIQPYSNSNIGDDNKYYVYVADTAGGISLWDLRQQRRLHVLKGAAGSIRKMSLTNDGQYLSCVGLDRFLRVYDTTNNKVQYAMYLKNRLNTCLFVNKKIPTKKIIKKNSKKNSNKVVYNDGDDLLQEIDNDSEDDEEDSDDNDNRNIEEVDDDEDNNSDNNDSDNNDSDENDSDENDDDDDKNNYPKRINKQQAVSNNQTSKRSRP